MEDAVPAGGRRGADGANNNGRDPKIDALSPEERSAIEELGHDPLRRKIAARDSLRLLELGLAELACGRLVLTQAGRTVLAKIRES